MVNIYVLPIWNTKHVKLFFHCHYLLLNEQPLEQWGLFANDQEANLHIHIVWNTISNWSSAV